MKKFFLVAAATAMLGATSGAFAQANPQGPQPSSTGAMQGTESRTMRNGTTGTGNAMATGSERGNNGNSMSGSNSVANPNNAAGSGAAGTK
jgi:hypothetical protein